MALIVINLFCSFREKSILQNSTISKPMLPSNYKNEQKVCPDLICERGIEADIGEIGIIYNARKVASCDLCIYKLSNENILNEKDTIPCNECLNKYFNVTSSINVLTDKSIAM